MKKLLLSVAIGAIITYFIMLFSYLAWGHEDNGYRHLEGDLKIGPHIIGMRWCPHDDISVASVDTDQDKIADECYFVKGEHNKIHFKPIGVKLRADGLCDERKLCE